MKLATYALDKQDIERFRSSLNDAYEIAPGHTRLRHAIAIVAANYFGGFLSEADRAPTRSGSHSSTTTGLTNSPRSRLATNLWTFSRRGRAIHGVGQYGWAVRTPMWPFRLSFRPLGQARFGCATQSGSGSVPQLLSQPSPSPYQTLFGLSMWLAARGDGLAPILAAAEPSFDDTTADALCAPAIADSASYLPMASGGVS